MTSLSPNLQATSGLSISADLACNATLRGGSLVVPGSNPRPYRNSTDHEFATTTRRLTQLQEIKAVVFSYDRPYDSDNSFESHAFRELFLWSAQRVQMLAQGECFQSWLLSFKPRC
ncbi:hypothetical protein TNCV_3396681 [Trichonephila clavipes]|nr:hypothetical protein TNCV_3396681 [Trichonephila clavipes]